MKLPEPLYAAVREHMDHHGDWHLARFRERWLPVPERADWRRARDTFPDLKFLDEVGAGEQFLTFHRTMVRQFKWIIDHTTGHNFRFVPWPRIRDDLVQGLPPTMLLHAHARILELVREGTRDQLGSFIERTQTDHTPGSNLHTALHGLIDAKESQDFPGDRSLREASMADLSVAHYNEHFWGLHGWIDNIYALWELAHGITPDQSPLEPSHDHHPALAPLKTNPVPPPHHTNGHADVVPNLPSPSPLPHVHPEPPPVPQVNVLSHHHSRPKP